MRTLTLACVAVILCIAPGLFADDKEALKKLEGAWKVESLEENEQKAPADVVAMFTITFKGDRFIIKSEAEGEKTFSIKLNSSAKPAAIDLTPDDPAKKDKKVLAIYKLEGETLTLCGTDENPDRPKEFAGGKKIALIVLKKQK